jgi:hypothetical protein
LERNKEDGAGGSQEGILSMERGLGMERVLGTGEGHIGEGFRDWRGFSGLERVFGIGEGLRDWRGFSGLERSEGVAWALPADGAPGRRPYGPAATAPRCFVSVLALRARSTTQRRLQSPTLPPLCALEES